MTTKQLAVAATLAALLGASCADTEPTPISGPGRPGDDPIVDWVDPTARIEFDVGWAIHACEGDAPLLCVERRGRHVGVVEAAGYAVDGFDGLDPATAPEENLAAFAGGFFESLVADRTAGCGAEYVFDPIGPTPFPIGGRPGISFGFTGTMPDGTPSELNLQYAVIVDGRIITISAIAYDAGGCPGRDDLSGFRSADLSDFRAYLEEVLRQSPLPEVAV